MSRCCGWLQFRRALQEPCGWTADTEFAGQTGFAVAPLADTVQADHGALADSESLGAALNGLRERAPSMTEGYVYDAAAHGTTQQLVRAAAEGPCGTGVDTRRRHPGTRSAAEFHARDRDSVREAPLVQPTTLRQARQLAGRRRLVVGSVGFRPRFNAVATGAEATLAPGGLPDTACAAPAAADALVLNDVVGRRGIAKCEDAIPHPGFPARAGEPHPSGRPCWRAAPRRRPPHPNRRAAILRSHLPRSRHHRPRWWWR